MKYLPFEKLIYTTDLSNEEVFKRLNNITIPKKTFRFRSILSDNTGNEYEGAVHSNFFTINRVINYRNSFLPMISGKILNKNEGSEIHVKMRPAVFVLVFMSLWMGGVSLTLLAFILSPNALDNFFPAGVIPMGMFLFGYLLITLGFKYESIKTKKYFITLFEAKIKTKQPIYQQ